MSYQSRRTVFTGARVPDLSVVRYRRCCVIDSSIAYERLLFTTVIPCRRLLLYPLIAVVSRGTHRCRVPVGGGGGGYSFCFVFTADVNRLAASTSWSRARVFVEMVHVQVLNCFLVSNARKQKFTRLIFHEKEP